MQYYGIHYDSVIEHHGIKGQKWGVRRYQNPDGTLTPLGRKKKLETTRQSNAFKTKKDVDDIISSLTPSDRKKFGLSKNETYLTELYWWVRDDNPGSIRLAETSGFKLDKSSVIEDDPWVLYKRK